jgi:hypothetical protein
MVLAAACGGSATQPEPKEPDAESASGDASKPAAPAESDTESTQTAADTEESGIPKSCAGKSDVCTPNRKFVDKLCKGNFPSVALVMFSKDTPWTRGYLRGETEAWNASGGASEQGKLSFDEEVLILRKRSADMGGMQVSGAGGGYDALRWNGSCVTLAAEEVTLDRPPTPKTARVELRWIDDTMVEVMRKDSKVDAAYMERRKECKGANSGQVSLKCVKADAKLSEVVVEYVRQGGELPEPQKLP